MSLKMWTATLALTMCAGQMAKADIQPMYSETSEASAEAGCQSRGGQVLGYNMETSTAQGDEFYMVVCERPDGQGGQQVVPTWSAINFQDAENRCTTPSVTTGLGPGFATGKEIYAKTRQPDIFIIVCQLP